MRRARGAWREGAGWRPAALAAIGTFLVACGNLAVPSAPEGSGTPATPTSAPSSTVRETFPSAGPTPALTPPIVAVPPPTPIPPGRGGGEWTALAEMGAARAYHTATLLSDGRVLVAGGNFRVESADGTIVVSLTSSEILDLASGTWTPAAEMNHDRSGHLAVRLADGRVLVLDGDGASGSAELFDPSSGTWTAAAHLEPARQSFTATLLPDGRVLVAGGGTPLDATDAATIYDPASDRWSATGPLRHARASHAAVLLADGTVLVAGGYVGYGNPVHQAERYDPSAGTWRAAGRLTDGRSRFASGLLGDGGVVVSGGLCCGDVPGFVASTEVFDPATATWRYARPDVGDKRHRPFFEDSLELSLLPDGRLVGVTSQAIWFLDRREIRWNRGPALDPNRVPAMTSLGDGTLLLTGGSTTDGATAGVFLYRP